MFTIIKHAFELIYYWKNENLKEHIIKFFCNIIHSIFTKFEIQIKIILLKSKTSFLTKIYVAVL